ncbi:MAG: hypothetical protein IJE16_07430 [Ruminococcus sp.]|nr:hypothetical protein [Ruminococcus sp.]
MYTELVKENSDYYSEENLNDTDKAFLYGVSCINNAIPDMLPKFIATICGEESEESIDKALLERFLEHIEENISEFQAEFIVTMIENYEKA